MSKDFVETSIMIDLYTRIQVYKGSIAPYDWEAPRPYKDTDGYSYVEYQGRGVMQPLDPASLVPCTSPLPTEYSHTDNPNIDLIKFYCTQGAELTFLFGVMHAPVKENGKICHHLCTEAHCMSGGTMSLRRDVDVAIPFPQVKSE